MPRDATLRNGDCYERVESARLAEVVATADKVVVMAVGKISMQLLASRQPDV